MSAETVPVANWGFDVGAVISIFFLMFRLMFTMVRFMMVSMVWMVQVTVVLVASMAGGGPRARLPRLRL